MICDKNLYNFEKVNKNSKKMNKKLIIFEI